MDRTSRDLLRSYARLLRRLSGAEAASLFLPAVPGTPGGARLVHDDGRPAVPELADAEAVGELRRVAGAAPRPSRRRRAPVTLPSAAPGGWLIAVPADPRGLAAGETPPGRGESRRKSDHRAAPERAPALWIGLRLPPDAGANRLDRKGDGVWQRALAHGAAIAALCRHLDAVVRDPVTELPGRAGFQAALRREVAAAIHYREPLALLLVNPDDFNLINERLGSPAGDAVARGVARRLEDALRSTDRVHRYGGIVFAVVLPGTGPAEAVAAAEKLHAVLTAEAYLDGAVRLDFSFGIANLEAADRGESTGRDAADRGPADRGPADRDAAGRDADEAVWALVERADRALSEAKLESGGRVVAWRPGSGEEEVVHRDRLAGIFTADLAKDYRNMLLLWDTVEIMTAGSDPAELTARAVARLGAAFKPDRVGLWRWAGGAARGPADRGSGHPELAAGHGVRGNGSRRSGEPILGDAGRALLERARAEGRLVEGRVPAGVPTTGPDVAYAVPLTARGECLGCLYLAGRAEALSLDASDLLFLKALAGQLAAALDRSELAAREEARLRAEVEELHTALEETRMVYRSPQMEALMATARQVAPTDITVLVTGASGTGKELVARAVHALSPRRSRPPVVIDCGAISQSLIDSALFGHEKGAFTGAAGRSAGRLAEGAGSTVILDEIGELPLEVQSKLLRFVQEKEITPVGGTRPRTIDARLVAVTNRDLAKEVAEGRFREDLYYRLKVLHLEVPALAERPEDVEHLIDCFVERFAARYNRNVRGLTPEARELAARYPWPGNVRELENRIRQAVILCDGEEIGRRDLALEVEAGARGARGAGPEGRAPRQAGIETMELDLEQLEKRHIERILASENGEVGQAARRLGIHRGTLYRKMKKFGIERDGSPADPSGGFDRSP